MFHGSLVALATPMDENGAIDYQSLTSLVDFHLANETDGLVVMGTTGESATVTQDEHHKVIRHVVEQVDSKIPVIAGSGATATDKTIELTLAAMELGVDACLIMAPAYVKPTQEGLYRHFKAVASADAIPQIIYNVPSRTACDVLPETVERLAELPNIIGIKEATGDPERAREIIARCGDKIDVYSGEDSVTKDLILLGGKGVISVTANVAPKLMHELCTVALQGDEQQANALNDKLLVLFKALFVESNPIPVKWALHMMGLIPAGIRLPLTPLAEQYRAHLHNVLIETGVLK